MIPIKYWNIWVWLMLACTILNVYFFIGGGGILSLVFAAVCGLGFYKNVIK